MVALTGLSLAIGNPGKELLGERGEWTSMSCGDSMFEKVGILSSWL